MAWSGGNKQYTMTWRSLKGRVCRVDIYVRGSQIPAPLSLQPADIPITIEEDASNDLLNDVVRFKTGYLRVKEVANQSISGLYPTDDFSHYVEFYYAGTLNFCGFLQAQDFNNEDLPLPCTREFAIASPLWAISKKKFNFDGISKNPQFITLGSLLDEVMASAGIYQSVIFPYFEDLKLDNTIWSQTFAPWNQDYNHIDRSTTSNPVYEVETYQWFLEAMCKAFGWVLHDDITALTFSMFDYQGRYAKYPVGHIGDPNYLDILTGPEGGVATALTTNVEEADNQGTLNIIQPFSRIRIEYEGEYITNDEVSYLRTFSRGYVQSDDVIHAVGLEPRLQQQEISPQGVAISFDSARKVATSGVNVAVFNTATEINKQIGIIYAIIGNEQDGDELFRVRLYTPFYTAPWRCKFTISSGATLNDLSEDDTEHRFGLIDCNVYEQGPGYVDCIFKVYRVGNYFNEMYSRWDNHWSVRDAIFFSDIRFYMDEEDSFDEYTTIVKGYDEILGQRTSFSAGEVTMPLHMYRKNDHMIGNTIRAQKFTEYPYLLNVRHELVEAFRITGNMPEHIWCTLWTYRQQNWRWRVIGYTFNPIDDELLLTIDRSATLE